MSLIALSFRLAATQVILREGAAIAHFQAAHSNDPEDPNKSYALYTPHAEFDFTVTNPEAFDFIKPGTVYDLVLTPRDGGNVIGVVPLVDPDDGTPVDAQQGDGDDVGDPPSDTPVIDAAAAAAVVAAASPAPATQPASDDAAAAATAPESAPAEAEAAAAPVEAEAAAAPVEAETPAAPQA